MKNILDRVFLKEKKWQRIPTSKLTQHPSPPLSQQATWLFLRRPEQLTVEEKEAVAHLCQIHEEVALAYQLS
jgi:hypothetical protein